MAAGAKWTRTAPASSATSSTSSSGGSSTSSGGGGDFLKTREGKAVVGGGAVLLVIVLALMKGKGSPAAPGGYSADALQGGLDGTLQDRLDQIGFRGGTLEEWIEATTGLAGSVDQLKDRLDAIDPGADDDGTPPSGSKPLPAGSRWPTAAKVTGTHGKTPSWLHYQTKAGDTLEALAQKFYGNKAAWTFIWDANKSVFGGHKSGKRTVGPNVPLVILNPHTGW